MEIAEAMNVKVAQIPSEVHGLTTKEIITRVLNREHEFKKRNEKGADAGYLLPHMHGALTFRACTNHAGAANLREHRRSSCSYFGPLAKFWIGESTLPKIKAGNTSGQIER